ncbi:363_t:CDS:1, partial [Diversispora eburnea]
DQQIEVQVGRSHLPSDGELSTCKGRPSNFVRSSDDELVKT